MNIYQGYAGERLLEIYRQLYGVQGRQNWWPAQSPLEVVIGAVLGQSTSWANVEKAIANLAENGLMPKRYGEDSSFVPTMESVGLSIIEFPEDKLGEIIRPAGFFRQKSQKLKSVMAFFSEICSFDFEWLAKSEQYKTDDLRRRLLAISGIGPETADSILLYALSRPTFIVDAYAIRMLGRHNLLPPMERIKSSTARYEFVREMILESLPKDIELYNEFHAQIVTACKNWCFKRAPRCFDCPLGKGLWNWQRRNLR